jgi:uncharacterized membrane protein
MAPRPTSARACAARRALAGAPPWAAIGLALVLCGCHRADADDGPAFTEVRPIVEKHCVSCHSASPTSVAFPIAPNNVVFDTPQDLAKHSEKILQRTVVDRTMPLLNKTEMTEAERELLARWLRAGARAR